MTYACNSCRFQTPVRSEIKNHAAIVGHFGWGEIDKTYLIRCATHGHYLKHAGVTGTTWRDSRSEARRYEDRTTAEAAEKLARWLDHDPRIEETT